MTVRLSTLPSGLRVITHAMGHLETASIGVWIDVGARNEPADLNGVSHILEHMAFKGTSRRRARDIAEEIESVGGHLNAYTSREHTTYYARVMKDDLPLAIDLLADILQHSLLEPDELSREKDVILQEIGQVEDTPDDVVFDHLQEVAFPGQPLGRSILGTSDRVSNFTTDMLRNFMRRHYHAGAMVITAAGNVDHDALCAAIDAAFADLPDASTRPIERAVYGGGELRSDKPLEQLHLALGFESLAYADADYYALQVFTTVLGGGMSSRLFQEIRENRGLAYSIYSFASSHVDTGLFGIYAGTGPEEAREMLPLIATEMHKLADGPDDNEIARARAQLKAGLLMSLESTSSRIEQLGRQALIFGRPIPIDEMIAKVDAIDATAVARVAARTLASPLSVATVGPSANVADLGSLQSLFGRLA
ncbi:MAG: insulinase family protein [Sphingomonadales bacterium]|nr:insulinase family protein [Sphingomonadales bacterium]